MPDQPPGGADPGALGLPSPSELEAIAVSAATEAAAIVADGLGRAVRLRTKSSSTDIVTDIDEASEASIRRVLSRQTPGCGIVGEESEAVNPGAPLQWVVDPLDGTVNFAYGVPIFSVSVAAGVLGEVVAGAVVDVVRGHAFTAVLGGGARCDGVALRASNAADLAQSLVATGFSYQPEVRAEQARIVAELLPLARDIRCFGSAALNLCWVGAGWIDAYFERDTKLWDYAAGALVAEESGAVVELPCPENAGLTIAAARSIFEALHLLVTPEAPVPATG